MSKPIKLSQAEQNNWVLAAKNGDDKSIELLIKNNLRLVTKIANRYKNQNLELEDLVSEGKIGIMKAIEKFDFSKNVKFSSYATWWVRHYIGNFCKKNIGPVKQPIGLINESYKVNKYRQQYYQRHNRSPKTFEIIKNLNIAPTRMQKIYGIYADNESLNDDNCLLELEGKEGAYNPNIYLFNCLTDYERDILEMANGLRGERMTYRKIGLQYGLNYREVAKIVAGAKSKLAIAIKKLNG
jgi:RNA polymerase primary sigma factor